MFCLFFRAIAIPSPVRGLGYIWKIFILGKKYQDNYEKPRSK